MTKNNIKTARIAKQYTQEEVALALNITRQAYGRYENGQRECSYDTLIKLSHLFAVSIDYLLGATKNLSSDSSAAMNMSERALLKKYRALSPSSRAIVDATLNASYEAIPSNQKFIVKKEVI